MSNRLVTAINLILSAGIYGSLLWLIYGVVRQEVPENSLRWLPHFNAACNAASTVAVGAGILLIRRGHRRGHALAMISATVASAAFLGGYLLHHALQGDTHFLGTGLIRWIYFFILLTHILLSGVALPLILNTLSFAALRRFAAHRRLARWTYPIWLYVSVTGVIIWFFLRVLNPSAGALL